MKISIDTDPRLIGMGVRVFLNGVEISHVTAADEEERYIDRLCTDERGRPFLNKERTDAARERLAGDVRIELPEAAAALRAASTGWRLPPPPMRRIPQ